MTNDTRLNIYLDTYFFLYTISSYLYYDMNVAKDINFQLKGCELILSQIPYLNLNLVCNKLKLLTLQCLCYNSILFYFNNE